FCGASMRRRYASARKPEIEMMLGALARGVLAAAALSLAGCGGDRPARPPAIQVDGSSTVFPLSEAAAELFTGSARGAARVTVGESGTGGGFRKFCRGETQVQGASRPILAEEMQ